MLLQGNRSRALSVSFENIRPLALSIMLWAASVRSTAEVLLNVSVSSFILVFLVPGVVGIFVFREVIGHLQDFIRDRLLGQLYTAL